MQIIPLFPTIGDLVARAIADTDFLSEITGKPEDLFDHTCTAISFAIDQWEEDHGVSLRGLSQVFTRRERTSLHDAYDKLIAEARAALIARGEAIQRQREADALDAYRDALDAGLIDRNGEPRWAP